MNKFDEWWQRLAHKLWTEADPETIARQAWSAAMAVSRNYVTDDEVEPTSIVFGNELEVRVVDFTNNPHLEVE